MPSSCQNERLRELMQKSLEDTLTPEEQQIFQDMVSSSSEMRDYYLDCMMVHAGLSKALGSLLFSAGNDVDDLNVALLAMCEHENTAPCIDVPIVQDTSQHEILHYVNRPSVKYIQFKKSSAATFIAVAASFLFFVIFIRLTPPKSDSAVAILSDSLYAQWEDTGVPMKNGMRFVLGSRSYLLKEGFVKLLFDNNTQITIEAPAEFQILDEDLLRLKYGRVYAIVPSEAYGFQVCTPNAKIIDLGTEFGVQHNVYGNTELHVLSGKTCLISSSGNNKIDVDVLAGSAKNLIGSTGNISDILCDGRLFVRDINSDLHFVWRGNTKIDLSDIVGGGNGFGTGRSEVGITWETGLIEKGGVETKRSPYGSYVQVDQSAYIDGVFVPTKKEAIPVISSTGLLFKECPEISGDYLLNINNGIASVDLTLNNIPFAIPENPALVIHANAGITFDLRKLRSSYPKFHITGFTSQFGIRDNQDFVNIAQADIWVLVDGQIVYSQREVTQGHLYEIDVPLFDSSNFLTLIVTEAGEGDNMDAWFHRHILGDWCIFGNPSLNFVVDAND